MLLRGSKRLVPLVFPLLVVGIITFRLYRKSLITSSPLLFPLANESSIEASTATNLQSSNPLQDQDVISTPDYGPPNPHHHELFSLTTPSKQYFPISFDNQPALNPNIIPHPHQNNTYIIIAQQPKSQTPNSIWYAELVCTAAFTANNTLSCLSPPQILPLAATQGGHCVGEREYFNLAIGPRDARVFYGPGNPFVVFGSNSGVTCLGMWMHDFRMCVDWGASASAPEVGRTAVELQRPGNGGYQELEKNWFVFWDWEGAAYVHHDVYPKRVFAKLGLEGGVGEDLAPVAALVGDERCLHRFMPAVAWQLESVHQATNSLSITLCARADPTCVPDVANTFVMTIFQHKTFYSFHSVYEPYVMLFSQTAPFAIHGISQKPLWISGRGKAEEGKGEEGYSGVDGERKRPWNQTEMFYVTSMTWEEKGMRYHGFADDVLFLAFGIEDSGTGGIDILGGDLLGGLGLCFGL